jgi:hypothetical protein
LIQLAVGISQSQGVTADITEIPGALVDAIRIVQRETKAVDAAIEEAAQNS